MKSWVGLSFLSLLAATSAISAPAGSAKLNSDFDFKRDGDRVLKRAIDLVERATPVSNKGKYRLAMRSLDGRGGRMTEYRGGTVILDSAELWAEWEKVRAFDTRPVVDVVTAVAKAIACNDPSLGLHKNKSGWLTSPRESACRRVNKFDTPAYNGVPGFYDYPVYTPRIGIRETLWLVPVKKR